MDAFHAFLSRTNLGATASGPLQGLRLAVKDNIAVKGEPFTAGLPLFADRRADRDAVCVEKLKRAGAQFVGMTRTDAAGFGVVTPEVTNPVWPDRIVGGSSGGSAAAVAAGLADIGLGTDTGGSTRIPAACCGLFGFKPSHGLIPLAGVWPLAPSLDVVGWMTRDLGTLEKVATVLLGASSTPVPAAKALRLGVDRERLAGCSAEVQQAFASLEALLAASSVQLREVTLPPEDAVTHAHALTVLAEAREAYADWTPNAELLPATARRALTVAQGISRSQIASARSALATISAAFDAAAAEVDAMITPTLPVEPPSVGLNRIELHGRSEPIVSVLVAQTCLANVTGGPALSVPIPHTRISVQILGRRHGDAHLFTTAHALRDAIADQV